ncbi:MAG: hypothetical protein ACFCU1_00225 [Sumerlaeia bacterium]
MENNTPRKTLQGWHSRGYVPHFGHAVQYIHQNPVKAGLVLRAEDWEWSNAGCNPAG